MNLHFERFSRAHFRGDWSLHLHLNQANYYNNGINELSSNSQISHQSFWPWAKSFLFSSSIILSCLRIVFFEDSSSLDSYWNFVLSRLVSSLFQNIVFRALWILPLFLLSGRKDSEFLGIDIAKQSELFKLIPLGSLDKIRRVIPVFAVFARVDFEAFVLYLSSRFNRDISFLLLSMMIYCYLFILRISLRLKTN